MDKWAKLLEQITFAQWVALTVGLVLLCLIIYFKWGRELGSRSANAMTAAERSNSKAWATRKELGGMVDTTTNDSRRIKLGTIGNRPVFTEPMRSTLVLAPTRSGKTMALVVPPVLFHDGPCVVASVKTDVLRLTKHWRESQGPVWVFNPSEPDATCRWSPIASIQDWSDALEATKWLQSSSKTGKAGVEDAEYWDSMARQMLAPLLMLAAAKNKTMGDVASWAAQVDTREEELAHNINLLGVPQAMDYWRSFMTTHPKTKSSIAGTLFRVLEPWGNPKIAHAVDITSADEEVFTIGDLFERNGTLYLVAPSKQQELYTPVFETLVNAILMEVETRAAHTGLPIDPPLFLCLDEAANIAPIRDLDKVASKAAGEGVILLTLWQDEGQINKRYGQDGSRTVVANHVNKVFLPGIADDETLSRLSRMIGRQTVQRITSSSNGVGRPTVSTQYSEVDVAPPSFLRQLPKSQAVLLSQSYKPAVITLRPWFEDPECRKRIDPAVAKQFDDYYARRR